MRQLFFQSVLPGTIVGCRYRWPASGFHPDCWQRPHKGEVLALDDVRAWSGSLAFPTQRPSQEAVSKHVEKCLSQGLLSDGRVPVLWTWSDDGRTAVYWDDELRPYAEELREWTRARGEAFAKLLEKERELVVG